MKHKRFNISNYNTVIANRLIHRRLIAMTNQNGFENGFNNNQENNHAANPFGEVSGNNENNNGAPYVGTPSEKAENPSVQASEARTEEILGNNEAVSSNTSFADGQRENDRPTSAEIPTPEVKKEPTVDNETAYARPEAASGYGDNAAGNEQSRFSQAPDYSAAAGERTYVGSNTSSNPYSQNNGSYPYTNSNPYSGSGSNSNPYSQQPNGQNGTPGQGYARPQSSGIRYDADKRAGDGSYTWNYYATDNGNAPYSNGFNGNAPEKAKSKTGTKVFIAVAVAFAMVCTAVVSAVFAGSYVRGKMLGGGEDIAVGDEKPVIGQTPGGSAENMVTVPSPSNGNGTLTKQAIAKKCKPSSVGIQTVVTAQGFYGMTYKTGGVGSGFILTEDGYIATNHHVIENADSITVQLDDGTKYEATLVGSDSVTDLAVLKIEATGLVPMEIGDSDKMVVGDSVIAIGTPAGIEFAGTVTDGIISAINRGVEITNDRGSVVKTMTLMQTNAAINPGNSGGPLINDKGQVIGINTLKLTSTYEGIGFSIPINSAVTIFNQLITDGKVSEYDSNFVTGNGAIGITNYVEISEAEAKYYNVPAGIVILQLERDSNAFEAGLKRYDTIIAFEGKDVKTVEELNKYKSAYKAGDEVTLTVYREGVGNVDITFKLDLMG